MSKTIERLSELEKVITQPGFLENKGLGNEAGYYIFDYPPKEEYVIRDWIKGKAAKDTASIRSIDLYDLTVTYLEEEGLLEQCYTFEKENSLAHLETVIGRLVEITKGSGWLVGKIRELSVGYSMVFISGVGKIFPLLRSHDVLNILHQNLDKVPTVMFYPGRYNEQDLRLFDKIDDGNYYRAFRIIN